MELTRVRYEVEHHVAYITLNNPDYMNVFDEPTDKELMQCFAACEFDPEVHVIVFQAEGRAFSGGGDINSMIGELQKPAGESVLLEESFSWPAQIARQIRAIRKPVIAALQGAVAGVAANLALMCDFRIAAENMKLVEAFVGIGLVTDGCGVYILNKMLGPARTAELVFTGRPVKAEEALRLGLVTEVVQPEELRARTKAFAEKLAAGPSKAQKYLKCLINQAAFQDMLGYSEVEIEYQRVCGASQDFREGVNAFLEKRKPVWTGK